MAVSMLDFPFMLHVQVKLPVVDRIQPYSNKFASGVGNRVTGDSNPNPTLLHILCAGNRLKY